MKVLAVWIDRKGIALGILHRRSLRDPEVK